MSCTLTLCATLLFLVATTAGSDPPAGDTADTGSDLIEAKAEEQTPCLNCEDDIGDSCRPGKPCCLPLTCLNGRCQPQIPGVTCFPPNSQCNPAAPINCCTALNQGCLFVPARNGLFCSACIPANGPCNPAIPPGFANGCCPGKICINNVCVIPPAPVG